MLGQTVKIVVGVGEVMEHVDSASKLVRGVIFLVQGNGERGILIRLGFPLDKSKRKGGC